MISIRWLLYKQCSPAILRLRGCFCESVWCLKSVSIRLATHVRCHPSSFLYFWIHRGLLVKLFSSKAGTRMLSSISSVMKAVRPSEEEEEEEEEWGGRGGGKLRCNKTIRIWVHRNMLSSGRKRKEIKREKKWGVLYYKNFLTPYSRRARAKVRDHWTSVYVFYTPLILVHQLWYC